MKLAYDKSARRYDADGRLHVERCRISKANVCPYRGDEIPDGEKLGLDPKRVYWLYRSPEELAKAAPTFANLPLTLHHIPVNVDAPAQELVVGVIGSDVSFEAPYLVASIALWTRDAVDAVESKTQEQLSCGYRYRVEMARGLTPEGVAFDGIMRDIVGNHVALVSEGRAGPDVVVADGNPNMKFKKTTAFLASFLGAAFTPELQLGFDSAMKEDLDGKDALPDLSEDEKSEAKLAMCKTLGRDTLTEEEETEAYKRAASDKKAKDSAPVASIGANPPHAADSAEALALVLATDSGKAHVQAAIDAAVAAAREGYVLVVDADAAAKTAGEKIAQDARAEVLAFLAARETVAPTVGVIALDSSTNTAESVYRFALDKLEVDHKATPASALPALYAAATKSAPAPATVALDSAHDAPNVRDLFPGLASIYRG